jgi:hypothetical protein
MDRNWVHIAKAELQVQTCGVRTHRRAVLLISFILGVIWAVVIAPYLMGFMLTDVLGIQQSVLVLVMPGLLRAGVMFIWVILLILPLSNALQEVKVGQWEILLSNNVQTRSILVGSFAGKLAIYGLYVLYLAPVLIAPFSQALEVSPIGQGLMYFTLFVIVVSTIWLSQLVVTAIQSKLGSSPRGKDLANAVAIALSLIAIFPLIGLQLFASLMMDVLGMDIFLLLPFTWSADLMAQTAMAFNGIGLTVGALDAVLGFTQTINVLLLGGFSLFLAVLGLMSADRFIVIGAGARTESVTTTKRENLVLRGIRRVSSGSFGVLVVTGFKDFCRKAQNISRLALFLVLALVIPFFVYIRAGVFEFTSVLTMTALMLGFLGVQAFGGAGFLESKDQLWTIKAAPHGVGSYVNAKVAQSILLIAPVAITPSIVYTVLLGLDIGQIISLMSISFLSCIGGAFLGIGIAANNPTYEDTKSGAYKANNVRGMMLVAASFMGFMVVDMVFSMLGFSELMNALWESQVFYILAQSMSLLTVGLLVLLIGRYRLSNHE